MAGSTSPNTGRGNQERDHPRVGGEHFCAVVSWRRSTGSPPRWRGAPEQWYPPSPSLGITPALAGSTAAATTAARPARDHPRVGGEHKYERLAELIPLGSPPRWRGARNWKYWQYRSGGITPALAGSTWKLRCCTRTVWDHPRVGGEHTRRLTPLCAQPGSPPRWRGAPIRAAISSAWSGITPALAGSTRDQRQE